MKVLATIAHDLALWLATWAAKHGAGHAVITKVTPDGTKTVREYGERVESRWAE